jgi:hypothetical protein
MLVCLRHPGRVLDGHEVPPPALLNYLARQLDVEPDAFAAYARRDQTRRTHLAELTTRLNLGQVEDKCKKWSQGRRLGGAGAFGDFSDYLPARSTAILLRIQRMLRSVDVAAALMPAVTAFADERGRRFGLGCQCIVGTLGAQQRLYLRPLPHGHGSLRPIFRPSRRRGAGREALARDRRCGSK